MVPKDAFHNLTDYAGQTNGSVVPWAILVPFLEDRRNIGQFPVVGHAAFPEGFVEDDAEWDGKLIFEFNENFCRDFIRTRC